MERADVESEFTPSENGSFMVRWGAGNPERRKDLGCQKKLCFSATDRAFLVQLLFELSNHPRAVFVKYSRNARDGMYLGRCFMLDEELVGALWRRYKPHPKLLCSVQDDVWIEGFRPDEPHVAAPGEERFPPRTLSTERLRLRPPEPGDVDAVFAYASDPEVTRYLAFPTHRSRGEARAFIERGMASWALRAGHLPWVIARRDDDVVIGSVGTDVHEHRVHLGYVLARPYWGRGLMTEALAAIRDAALSDPRVTRLEAYHHHANPASGRVLEKIGMRREGVLRAYAMHPQAGREPHDVVLWAMVRNREPVRV